MASVLVSGRQGREQRRLLLEERQRDLIERRADFELGLLMRLTELTRTAWSWQRVTPPQDMTQTRALLLALPPDLLPILRARSAPLDDTLADEVLAPYKGDDFRKNVQRAIDRELRDAIFERRDALANAPVSNPLARRSWRTLWLARR